MIDAITKLIIPLVSPLIAALALVLGLRNEIRKLRTQQEYDRRQRAESVFTEVVYAYDLAKLISQQYTLGEVNRAHQDEVRRSFERIMDKVMAEPQIGDRFLEDVKFKNKRHNMFVLLAEARVRLAKTEFDKRDLLLVQLALLTMSYLYETEEQRRHSETYKAIELIHASDPEFFSAVIVEKSTPCLREYRG